MEVLRRPIELARHMTTMPGTRHTHPVPGVFVSGAEIGVFKGGGLNGSTQHLHHTAPPGFECQGLEGSIVEVVRSFE